MIAFHQFLLHLLLLHFRFRGAFLMATPTRFNPREKKEPLWYRLRLRRSQFSDDFKKSPECACIDQWHFFFSNDLSDQAVAKKICATCPMLRPCTMWAIHGGYDGDDPFWIIAGMEPEWRRLIREGHENFWDWSQEFNFPAQAARAAARKRAYRGQRKRDQRRADKAPCPRCGSNECVVRDGRDRTTNRQQYRCFDCGPFLGEEL
jgi:predicted RNA-binding Zn-ribbon protein involved in translation (DUF1610 family)